MEMEKRRRGRTRSGGFTKKRLSSDDIDEKKLCRALQQDEALVDRANAIVISLCRGVLVQFIIISSRLGFAQE